MIQKQAFLYIAVFPAFYHKMQNRCQRPEDKRGTYARSSCGKAPCEYA